MAEVLAPVCGRDLVANQRIHGDLVWHPQQCFGKTHQRDAFFRGQAIFTEKGLHDAGIIGAAKICDKMRSLIDNLFPGSLG